MNDDSEIRLGIDEDDDAEVERIWTCRRIVVLIVTLFVIFSFLAVNYLPGIIAMYQNAERRTLPTPTVLPIF